MTKSKIKCPLCDVGKATLKHEDNLYFYECDTCMSDFVNNEICKMNKEMKTCCNHDCSQGKECPNRKSFKDDSIIAYIMFILLTIITVLLCKS